MIYRPASSHCELEYWQMRARDFYARSGHALVDELERRLAALEGSRGAVATASGMAALTMILVGLRCNRRTHLWSHDGAFPQTNELLWLWGKMTGCRVSQVPTLPMRMSKTRRNIVFLQSPRSDTLESFSLADTIAALRADDPAVTIVVDNSIVTSLRERPLHYGADIVWASVSKYYSGHGTVLAGVAYSNDETTLHTWRMDARYLLGLILGHQAAREALQGLETLAVRLEQSTAHAQVLVDELRTYPWVTHLQHVNSLIAFHCAEAEWVVNSLQKFDLSVHWGHVRSTAVYDMWADRIRLSIGLESPSELLADLRQAFARNFLTREVR